MNIVLGKSSAMLHETAQMTVDLQSDEYSDVSG